MFSNVLWWTCTGFIASNSANQLLLLIKSPTKLATNKASQNNLDQILKKDASMHRSRKRSGSCDKKRFPKNTLSYEKFPTMLVFGSNSLKNLQRQKLGWGRSRKKNFFFAQAAKFAADLKTGNSCFCANTENTENCGEITELFTAKTTGKHALKCSLVNGKF